MRYLLLLVFWITVDSLCAQVPVMLEHKNRPSFKVEHAVQSRSGGIWFVGDRQIGYFNGYELTEMNADSALEGKFSCAAAYGTELLLGTNRGDLYRMTRINEGLVQVHRAKEEVRITKIYVDDGQVYFSTYGKGLIRMSSFSRLDTLDFPFHYIHDICLDAKTWLLATDDGLFRSEPEGRSPVAVLEKTICTDILACGSTTWVMGYAGTVFRLDTQGNRIYQYALPSGERVLNAVATSDELVVSTRTGIHGLDRNGVWKLWFDDIVHAGVVCMLVDDENNLWFFNERRRISKGVLALRKWPEQVPPFVQSILNNDSIMFFGTSDGLYILNNHTGQWAEPVRGMNVTCMTNIDQQLIVGTLSHGLVLASMKDLAQGKQEFQSLSGSSASVLSLSVSRGSEILAGSLSGLEVIENDKTGDWMEKVPPGKSILSEHYIISIDASDGESVLLGTDKAGLLILKGDTIEKIDHLPDGRELGSVLSITTDPRGVVWISSETCGILNYRNGELSTWKHPHNDVSTYFSLVSHNDKLLMIGESRVDIYNSTDGSLVSYGDEVGLGYDKGFLNNFSNSSEDAWFVHDNTLWKFGWSEEDFRTEPVTTIDEVTVNLKAISGEEHEFDHSENNFTFRVTGVLHRNIERVVYYYRLQGFDKQWRSTKDRTIEYPQLPPGNYTFEVQAAHDEDVEPDHPVQYAFTVLAPYYLRPWFIALCVVAILSIWLIYDRRRKHIITIRSEVSRLETEASLINLKNQLNPHFLFNSFNTLIGLIEEDPDKGVEFTELLTDFYRGILETSEKKWIPLQRELEITRLYSKLLIERFGDALNFEIDVTDISGFVPPLVLQMLIENAVKHNAARVNRPLNIRVSRQGEWLNVSNNLNPLQVPAASTGIGLSNIRQRYQLLMGTDIQIRRTVEVFEVIIPVKNEA